MSLRMTTAKHCLQPAGSSRFNNALNFEHRRVPLQGISVAQDGRERLRPNRAARVIRAATVDLQSKSRTRTPTRRSEGVRL
jgi:hypothetical protein